MHLYWVRTLDLGKDILTYLFTMLCSALFKVLHLHSSHDPGGVVDDIHPAVLDALTPVPNHLFPLDVLAVHAGVRADHANLLVGQGYCGALKLTIKSHTVLPAWEQIREVIRNLVFTF